MSRHCSQPFSVTLLLVTGCVTLLSTGVLLAAPLEVDVAKPVERVVADAVDCAGRLDATTKVQLRARVTGYLDRVRFKEGELVKQGQVLFEIDSRAHQAELDRAQAELVLAEARFKLADAELSRARKLQASKAINEAEVDKFTAARDEARALIELGKAKIALARINLDYTKVLAPLDGRIGRTRVDPGNLVVADSTLLATIVTLSPIHVHFDLDEATVLRLHRRGVEPKDQPKNLPIAVGLADEQGFPHKGIVDFVDIQVNAETGTLHLRGTLANANGLLIPGLSAHVRLVVGEPRKMLHVSQAAVHRTKGRYYVLIVNAQNVVESRSVQLGPLTEGLRAIASGLKPDELVVVTTGTKLNPGDKVGPRAIPLRFDKD